VIVEARFGAELLAAAGADLVVTTLVDVDLAALCDGRLAKKGKIVGRLMAVPTIS
jgi:hypothetical protein